MVSNLCTGYIHPHVYPNAFLTTHANKISIQFGCVNSDTACTNRQLCTYVKMKGGSALSVMCEIWYMKSRLILQTASELIYTWFWTTLWQEQVVTFRTSKLCRKSVAIITNTLQFIEWTTGWICLLTKPKHPIHYHHMFPLVEVCVRL